ncbi:unnamed protein product [Rhizophagus irregularis]|nr:unnamed protein product [Rhizophagus irregularis]CAB5383580.1 unnamed protein product [Rhizophagus irregularis]
MGDAGWTCYETREVRKDKKKRAFSSYKTKKELKEVLAKYGVQDGRITDIPQFTPKPHNIDDKNEALIRSECYTMRKCFTN